jgi:hypothetical protein
MSTKIDRFIIFLACVVTVSFIFSGFEINHACGQEEPNIAKQKTKELERKISELQNGNALLMENLANCMEENDSLRENLGDGKQMGSQEEKGKKRAIIKLIQSSLKTQTDLSFLMKLQEDQLKTLLDIIMKRAK